MTLERAQDFAIWSAERGDPYRRERQAAHEALLDAVVARRPPPGVFVDAGGGAGALAMTAQLRGYRAVSVDILATRGVRADFAQLPVRRADVVAFSASLHYAEDVGATLRDAPADLVAVALTPVHDDAAAAERAARRMPIRGYRHLTRAELERALEPFRRVEWLEPGFAEPWHRRARRALRPRAYASFPLVVAQR